MSIAEASVVRLDQAMGLC